MSLEPKPGDAPIKGLLSLETRLNEAMLDQLEEDVLEGLHYSPEYWLAITERIPPGANEKHIRDSLERAALSYAWNQTAWVKGERMQALHADAKKMAAAADAFLDALERYGGDPVHAGLGRLEVRDKDGMPHQIEDVQIADERYAQMIEAVRAIRDSDRLRSGGIVDKESGKLMPGEGLSISSRKGEKILRRKYVEGVAQTWIHLCGKTLGGDDIGPALDFIEAATRPVLLGGDRFGQGESGRDALAKLVDAFRNEGFKFQLYHWEIYAQR